MFSTRGGHGATQRPEIKAEEGVIGRVRKYLELRKKALDNADTLSSEFFTPGAYLDESQVFGKQVVGRDQLSTYFAHAAPPLDLLHNFDMELKPEVLDKRTCTFADTVVFYGTTTTFGGLKTLHVRAVFTFAKGGQQLERIVFASSYLGRCAAP
jgi:hypothetical protein